MLPFRLSEIVFQKIGRRASLVAVVAATLAVIAVMSWHPADAQTYTEKTLYTFCAETSCADGGVPAYGVIHEGADFYGVTIAGGDPDCKCGTVFRLTPSDKTQRYSVLHTFTGQLDGESPAGGVIADSQGNLYGTAYGGGPEGGACLQNNTVGCGVVFKIDAHGNYSVLHNFCNDYNPQQHYCIDSGNPAGNLLRDPDGNLYGTTQNGTVQILYKLDPANNFTVLHTFCEKRNCADGLLPEGNLIRDGAGNLYGVAFQGGTHNCSVNRTNNGCGLVFRLTAAGQYEVLHDFDGTDGSGPIGGLVRDTSGNLYGTTNGGGANGAGLVFKLSKTRIYTALYNFCSVSNRYYCVDGGGPSGSLVLDKTGDLFGTTPLGGNSGGVVFKMHDDSNYMVIHQFPTANGDGPTAGVVMSATGILYGTTYEALDKGGISGQNGPGEVFMLTPSAAATE